MAIDLEAHRKRQAKAIEVNIHKWGEEEFMNHNVNDLTQKDYEAYDRTQTKTKKNKILNELDNDNNIVVAPTGTGKTFSVVQWLSQNKNKKIIVLTNSNSNVQGYENEIKKQGIEDLNILYLSRDTQTKISSDKKLKFYDKGEKTYKELKDFDVIISTHTYAGYKGHTIEKFSVFQKFLRGYYEDKYGKIKEIHNGLHKIIIDEGHEFINKQYQNILIRANYVMNGSGQFKLKETYNKGNKPYLAGRLIFNQNAIGTSDTAQQWFLPNELNDDIYNFDLSKEFKVGRDWKREKNSHSTETIREITNLDELHLKYNDDKSPQGQFIYRLLKSSTTPKLIYKKPITTTEQVDGETKKRTTEHQIKNANNIWLSWTDKIDLPLYMTTFLTATLNTDEIPNELQECKIINIKPNLDHIDINRLNLKAFKKNNASTVFNNLDEDDKKNTLVIFKTKAQMLENYKKINYAEHKKLSYTKGYQSDFNSSSGGLTNQVTHDVAITYAGHPRSTGANLHDFKNLIVECDRYRPLVARLKGDKIINQLDDKEAIIMQNIGRVLRTKETDPFNQTRNIFLSKCEEDLAIKIESNLVKAFPNWIEETITSKKDKNPLLQALSSGRQTLTQIHKIFIDLGHKIDKKQLKEALDRNDKIIKKSQYYSLRGAN